MNIRHALENQLGANENIRLNDVDVDPASIRAVMINEVVPEDPAQDFYGSSGELYLSTTIPLFHKAGLPVEKMDDILRMGIYITNAVKMPKHGYAVEKSSMEDSLPYLEQELALFPNVRVSMLMGDVAKKMFNQIARTTVTRNHDRRQYPDRKVQSDDGGRGYRPYGRAGQMNNNNTPD